MEIILTIVSAKDNFFSKSFFGPKVVQAENLCCTLPIENLYAQAAAGAKPGKNDFSDAYMDACSRCA